ncbi:hypothetical protein [Cupriavidus sp. YAF13]|uniref:hypothetical protein n=1 Tax=Cupriavidus sp. YAF13 TaxID=3233075 RepID=UPI003F8E025B
MQKPNEPKGPAFAIRIMLCALACVVVADYLLKAARACSTMQGLYMIDQESGASWCVSYQTLGGGFLLVGLLLVAVGAVFAFSSKGE